MPAKKSKKIKVTKKTKLPKRWPKGTEVKLQFTHTPTINVGHEKYLGKVGKSLVDHLALQGYPAMTPIVFTKPKPKKRWKPNEGDTHWYFDREGTVRFMMWIDDFDDSFKFGNCFKTKEEAESARDKVRELLRGL